MSGAPVILDSFGLTVVGIYLAGLLVLGWMGRVARKRSDLIDFYLGGRELGSFVLLLTLFATQYSGNTLLGFAGRAYRDGFSFLVAPAFMMAIVGAYLIYAPKLFPLSRRRQYVTTADFLLDRYGSRPLATLGSLVGVVALCNYLISNLKAMGVLVVEASGGALSMVHGVLALSIVLLIYETLGGLRSVAWTDVLQGVLLAIGCAAILGVLLFLRDGWTLLTEVLPRQRPEFWAPPTLFQKSSWLSSLILVGFGVSLYPHAVQRIYAAESARTLKRSLRWMVFLPLVTTLFMLVVGWIGAAMVPGLEGDQSDRIAVILLNDLVRETPSLRILLVIFVAAVIAAIMSTLDSALLSLSSSITKDMIHPLRPDISEQRLTALGKILSWLLLGLMAALALAVQGTIWRLVEIKIELLIQLVPAVFLGLYWSRLQARPVLIGMLAGLGLTFGLMLLGGFGNPFWSKPWGIHAGVWGLLLNFTVVLAMARTRALAADLLG